MLLLGLCALIQILFLPGIIGLMWVRNLNLVDRFLLSLPMSIFINYVVVLFLVMLGSYNQLTLLSIFVCELFVLTVYGIRHRNAFTQLSWGGLFPKTLSLSKAEQVLLPVAVVVASWLIAEGVRRAGTVFWSWDAVVSWNPWAISWVNGHIPKADTYPQAISILYSITYQFIGDTRVQMFAYAVAITFPLAMLITLVRLYTKACEKPLFLMSVPLTILFIMGSSTYIGILYSGYADMPLAYYGVLVCYLLLLLHERSSFRIYNDPFVYIAVCCVATAALFKQPGLLTAVLFPVVWYIYIGRGVVNPIRQLLYLSSLTVIIAGHWYAYVWLSSGGINTAPYTSLLPSQTWFRPIHGINLLFSEIGWVWLLPFVIGLRHTHARKLAFWGILPIFLLWAFMASYDLRAMYLALPWVSMVVAAGVIIFYDWSSVSKARFSLFAIWVLMMVAEIAIRLISLISVSYVARSVIILLLIIYGFFALSYFRSKGWISQTNQRVVRQIAAGTFVIIVIGWALVKVTRYPDERLIKASITMQKEIGVAELNSFMLKYFEQNPAQGNIASSYQFLGKVPGLTERYRLFYCHDFSFLEDPTIGYFVYPPTCLDVKDQIAGPLAARFTKISSISGYDFFKVNK